MLDVSSIRPKAKFSNKPIFAVVTSRGQLSAIGMWLVCFSLSSFWIKVNGIEQSQKYTSRIANDEIHYFYDVFVSESMRFKPEKSKQSEWRGEMSVSFPKTLIVLLDG
ncbi:hypothetical protein J6590_076741 [Homalodisca vitripennis]|nr:hypothetical protein J6590_076741 [Homalodisca vitripennis]